VFISLIKSIKRVRWCGCVMFNLIIPFVFLVPLIAIGQPVPEKGFLDASGIDFKAEKSIPLTGEWEFYWKELVKPDEFDRKDKNFTYFPQLWNDIEGVKPTGYATYRLRIQLGDNPPDLALRLPDFYTAYELYANGEKVGSNGKVGTSKEEYKPFWLDQVVSVHPDSAGKLNIVLHIANFEHSKGGPKESILFGSEEYLRSQQSKEFYYAFFLAGCLLMGGLFFLGLYLFLVLHYLQLPYGRIPDLSSALRS